MKTEKSIPKALLLRRDKAIDKVQKAMAEVGKRNMAVYDIDIQIFTARTGISIGTPIFYTTDYRTFVWGIVVALAWMSKTNIQVKYANVDAGYKITDDICVAPFKPDRLKAGQYHKIIGLREYQTKLWAGVK